MLKLVRSGTPVQESQSDAPASKTMTMVEDTASHTLPHAQGEGLVMIIDDQVTGRRILEEIVRGIDDELIIETYAEPQQALKRIQQVTPDLIITDYKMPSMDGLQFTRRVRGMPRCKDVPLVVVTIVEDRQVRYKVLEAGATDFLNRPIDQYECRARIRNLLKLREQQRIIQNRARWLEDQVALSTAQIVERERETLLRLARAGEYRDEETGNHVLRMARYSKLIARELGLSAGTCDEIEYAAPMHDIGKIGIPDHILLKPGRLNSHEFAIMKEHCRIGYSILEDSPSRYLKLGSEIALYHHEHWDGKGYPEGLSGDTIPISARIVAIADIFDALTSQRPYKEPWPVDDAVTYIIEQAGKQLDPACVAAFEKVLPQILETMERFSDASETTFPAFLNKRPAQRPFHDDEDTTS
jgi:two-component system response regulator RpfG